MLHNQGTHTNLQLTFIKFIGRCNCLRQSNRNFSGIRVLSSNVMYTLIREFRTILVDRETKSRRWIYQLNTIFTRDIKARKMEKLQSTTKYASFICLVKKKSLKITNQPTQFHFDEIHFKRRKTAFPDFPIFTKFTDRRKFSRLVA